MVALDAREAASSWIFSISRWDGVRAAELPPELPTLAAGSALAAVVALDAREAASSWIFSISRWDGELISLSIKQLKF